MLRKAIVYLVLLSVAPLMATTEDFKLGVDYSELMPTGALTLPANAAVASDSRGAVYLLLSEATAPGSAYLVKLAPGGDQIVYQTELAFVGVYLAVDPAGNAYVAGNYSIDGSNFVEKLATDGKTILYKTVVGSVTGITADASGRAYAAGYGAPGNFVTRLKADGAVDYSMNPLGQPVGIAVDGSGSAYIFGIASQGFTATPGAYLTSGGYSFLARVADDGSKLIYATFLPGTGGLCCLAVDPAGDAVVAAQDFSPTGSLIIRLNPQGTAAAFTQNLPGQFPRGLALDAGGDTYVTSWWNGGNYRAKNSLTTCAPGGTSALTVLDPSGEILQATYLAGASNPALGPNSTVYIAGTPDSSYAPTRQLAGPAGGLVFLTQLSPHAQAPTVQLACEGNAASYDSSAISGGELVSLFGEGLGPTVGTEPQVDPTAGFPKQLAGVQVTFDGTPGPLLYVQEGQVNAIAPWSLQPGQTVEVCVLYDGSPTNCITRPVANAHPGVFTYDGENAVAVNQDGTLVSTSHPPPIDSIVTVYATGLGPINPSQLDGSIIGFPLPVDLLPVTMNGQGFGIRGPITIPMPVKYAGPAPYEVAGVSQLNFVLNNGLQIFLSAGSGTCTFFVQQ
jgi:uncharacterized protein (TIGR03437 family)